MSARCICIFKQNMEPPENFPSDSDVSLVPVTVSADKNQVKRALENEHEIEGVWSKMKAVPICIFGLT